MTAVKNMMDKQAPTNFLSLPSTADERSYALLRADCDPLSPRAPDIQSEEVVRGQNSRYKTEFRELEKIGKGGFGSVYKVKNKLDQREYAVKKIILKQKHPESARKVLREVQLLASLDHANIVGYNSAWIEAEPVCPPKAKIWTMPTAEDFRSTEVRFNRSISHEGISQSPPDILTKPIIQSPPTNTSTLTAPSNRPSNVHSPKKSESTTKTPPIIVKAASKRLYQTPEQAFQPLQPQGFYNDHNYTTLGIREIDSESEYLEMSTTKTCDTQKKESSESNPSKSSDSLDKLLSSHGMCGSLASASKQTPKAKEISFAEQTSSCGFEESDFKFTGTSSMQARYEEDSELSDFSIHFENSTQVQSSVMTSGFSSEVQSEKVDIKHVSNKHMTETSIKMESKTEVKSNNLEVCRLQPGNGALLPGHFGFRNLPHRLSRERLKATAKKQDPDDGDIANRKKQFRRRAVSFDPSSEFSRGEMDMRMVPSGSTLFEGLSVTLYIQMQLCSRTLAGWLKERNEHADKLSDSFDVVDEGCNLKIFEGIMKGVHYIHSNGFMHRDLKPKNIFLDGNNLHVRIGDFGLARHDVVEQSRSSSDEEYPLTPLDTWKFNNWDFSSSYMLHTSGVGTATYASPEQLNGSDYDSKSDMYSAGIILFELFHPFSTGMERARCMGDLRQGQIAAEVKKRWPKQSSLMEELLALNSKDRPGADVVLQSELFVSKDEMISRLQNELLEKNKFLSQKEWELKERSAELRDAKQLLKEKDAIIFELSQNKLSQKI